ncbi:MAG: acetate--CoA ligase family protein, partial [Desulfopila sp.]|nr:acetate--CoA ligase family protein [Desulfopila sp.]
METHVDFSAITALFTDAEKKGRNYLFEYEVYDLIRLAGSETPPEYQVLPKNSRIEKHDVDVLPGEKVVIKILSPLILHKSDVGGVRIVRKTLEDVLSCVRRMYYEIPAAFIELVRQKKFAPPEGMPLGNGDALRRYISDSIEGVVLCRYMPPDSEEFGNELLVS